LRLRDAEKHLVHDIKSFLDHIEEKSGAQVFVMIGYQKPDDTIAVAKYVIGKATSHHSPLIISPRFQTKPRVGQLFTTEKPDWKVNTWKHWGNYVQEHYSKLCIQ
jgi:aspartate carbamoyltransferase regulatory subunit